MWKGRGRKGREENGMEGGKRIRDERAKGASAGVFSGWGARCVTKACVGSA